MTTKTPPEPAGASPDHQQTQGPQNVYDNPHRIAGIGLLLVLCPTLWLTYLCVHPEAILDESTPGRRFHVFVGSAMAMGFCMMGGAIMFLSAMYEIPQPVGPWVLIDVFIAWVAALPIAGALMEGDFWVDWLAVTMWFVLIVWGYFFVAVQRGGGGGGAAAAAASEAKSRGKDAIGKEE